MEMIIGFDLDDTLYRELDYLESGFHAVSDSMESLYGIPADEAFSVMIQSLVLHGRGVQLDQLLKHFDLFTSARRDQLLRIYRSHHPALVLPDATKTVLESLRDQGYRLFLVTDGHSRVQARKIEVLGLRQYFEHCYLTWRYGHESQKPSPRCFELILKRTGMQAKQLIYVGDNPHKDFVGVRSLGGATIRVLTGAHSEVEPDACHEADLTVDSISEVPEGISKVRCLGVADLFDT